MSAMVDTSMKSKALAAMLAVGIAAGLAIAAGDPEGGTGGGAKFSGGFDQPLHGGRDSSRDSMSHSSMMFVQDINGKKVTLKIEDGETSATVDGKAVPADRIKREGDKVRILDESGSEIASFAMVGGMGGLGESMPFMSGGTFGGDGNWKSLDQLAQVKPPKAMLGITMSDPAEGEGVLVDSVLEGLPASKAGLKVGDVVVAVDGKGVASQGEMREILSGKDAGDEVSLKILRGGESKVLTVRLEAYSRDKLWTREFNPARPRLSAKTEGKDRAWFDEQLKALDRAMEDIKKSQSLDTLKNKSGETIEAAKKALEEARQKLVESLERGPDWSEFGDEVSESMRRLLGPNGDVFVMRAPAPEAEAAGAVADDSNRLAGSLDRLADQMDRLEKRMASIEKRLAEQEKNGDRE